jgi:hypothetical protein
MASYFSGLARTRPRTYSDPTLGLTPRNIYAEEFSFGIRRSVVPNSTTSVTFFPPFPSDVQDRSGSSSTILIPDIEVTPPSRCPSPVVDLTRQSPSFLQVPKPAKRNSRKRSASSNSESEPVKALKFGCESRDFFPWMKKVRRIRAYLLENKHIKPVWDKIYSATREYPYDDFMSEDDVGLFLAELEDDELGSGDLGETH